MISTAIKIYRYPNILVNETWGVVTLPVDETSENLGLISTATIDQESYGLITERGEPTGGAVVASATSPDYGSISGSNAFLDSPSEDYGTILERVVEQEDFGSVGAPIFPYTEQVSVVYSYNRNSIDTTVYDDYGSLPDTTNYEDYGLISQFTGYENYGFLLFNNQFGYPYGTIEIGGSAPTESDVDTFIGSGSITIDRNVTGITSYIEKVTKSYSSVGLGTFSNIESFARTRPYIGLGTFGFAGGSDILSYENYGLITTIVAPGSYENYGSIVDVLNIYEDYGSLNGFKSVERVAYSYNTGSFYVIPTPSTEDYGSIGVAVTTIDNYGGIPGTEIYEDYGSIKAVFDSSFREDLDLLTTARTFYDDYGTVSNPVAVEGLFGLVQDYGPIIPVLNPFGTINLSGEVGVIIEVENIFSGSGSITIDRNTAGVATAIYSRARAFDTTGIGTFSGVVNDSLIKPYIGLGTFGFSGGSDVLTYDNYGLITTLVLPGSYENYGSISDVLNIYEDYGSLNALRSVESVTYDYNVDSFYVIPTPSTEDYGSIGAAVTSTENYGNVSDLFGPAQDYGPIIPVLNPFGTINLSGSSDVVIEIENIFTGSGGIVINRNTAGVATAIYSRARAFDTTGIGTFSGVVNDSLIKPYIGLGTFGFAGGSDVLTYDNYGFIITLVAPGSYENYGSVVDVLNIYEDYGSLNGFKSVERVAYSYNRDSFYVIPTPSTEDYGSIGAAVTSIDNYGGIPGTEIYEDYGSIKSIFNSSFYEDLGLLTTARTFYEDYGTVSNPVVVEGLFGLTQDYGPIIPVLNPFGTINLSGSSDVVIEIENIFTGSGGIVVNRNTAGVATAIYSRARAFDTTGIGTFSGVVNDSLIKPYIGLGTIDVSGSRIEKRIYSYNQDSFYVIPTPSTEDYGSIGAAVTSTENYGNVGDLFGPVENYGPIIPVLNPFGTINLSGSSDVVIEIENIFTGSGGIVVNRNTAGVATAIYSRARAFDTTGIGTFSGVVNDSLIKTYIGLGTVGILGGSDILSYDNYGLITTLVLPGSYENYGSIVEVINLYEDYGALIELRSVERVAYSYNRDSFYVIPTPSTEDYGSIGAAVTSTENYGNVGDLFGPVENYGPIIPVLNPFGTINLSGSSDVVIEIENIFTGSGTIVVDRNTAGVATAIYSRARAFDTTGIGTFSGVVNDSLIKPYIGLGTVGILGGSDILSYDNYGLITTLVLPGSYENYGSISDVLNIYEDYGSLNGFKSVERVAYSYNRDSFYVIPTPSSEDYGSIGAAVTSTENYGNVGDLFGPAQDYGPIIPVLNPFGTINLSGSSDVVIEIENIFTGSGGIVVNRNTAGVATAIYSRARAFDTTGIGTFSGVVNDSLIKPYIGLGTIDVSGSRIEKRTYSYNIDSIDTTLYDDYGNLLGSPTYEDYGLITLAVDGQYEIYGFLLFNNQIGYPYGTIEISGAILRESDVDSYVGSGLITVSGVAAAVEKITKSDVGVGLGTFTNIESFVRTRSYVGLGTVGILGGSDTLIYDNYGLITTLVLPGSYENYGSISDVLNIYEDYGSLNALRSVESVTYDYNVDSFYVIPTPSTEDYGSNLSDPITSIDDYGNVGDLFGPTENYGPIIPVLNPFGTINLSGSSDIIIEVENIFNGSGGIVINRNTAGVATAIYSRARAFDTTGIGTFSGSASESFQEGIYTGSGLFEISGGSDILTYDNYGLITTLVLPGSYEDLGFLTTARSSYDDYGILEFKFVESVTFDYNIDSTTEVFINENFGAVDLIPDQPEDDYGLVLDSPTEPEDVYGFVIKTSGAYPYGTVDISGTASSQIQVFSHLASGGISIDRNTVGVATAIDSLTKVFVTDGLGTFGGSAETSYEGEFIHVGSGIFGFFGGSDSVEDFGFVFDLATYEDNGSVADHTGFYEDYGSLIPIPFVLVERITKADVGIGTINISGAVTENRYIPEWTGSGTIVVDRNTVGVATAIDSLTKVFVTDGLGTFSGNAATRYEAEFTYAGEGTATFSGIAVTSRTKSDVGVGLITISGDAETRTNLPENLGGTIVISGNALERITPATHVGVGTFNVVGYSSESITYKYDLNSINAFFSIDYGLIANIGDYFDGDNGLISNFVYSYLYDDYGLIANETLYPATGTIQISGASQDAEIQTYSYNASGIATFSGAIVDTRSRSYVGVGTIFVADSAKESTTPSTYIASGSGQFSAIVGRSFESAGFNPPDQTVNVVISGIGSDRFITSRSYSGIGTINISGNAFPIFYTPDYLATGGINISGNADPTRYVPLNVGVGTIFIIRGSAESFTVNPTVPSAQVIITGVGRESFTPTTHIGIGTIIMSGVGIAISNPFRAPFVFVTII